jgi:hypothetical protein
MAKKETQTQTQKRILILCVDRDGDLEVKSAIKTPLLGRTANLDGAVALALKDPEELTQTPCLKPFASTTDYILL